MIMFICLEDLQKVTHAYLKFIIIVRDMIHAFKVKNSPPKNI